MSATKAQAVDALKKLREFIGASQLSAIASACRGEEKEFFFDKVDQLAKLIDTMPKVYEQDGKDENSTVYLHYFRGNQDWWITEKDSEPGQHQAFGYVQMGGCSEWGYTSIAEIIKYGVELDLYFKPSTLMELYEKGRIKQ